MNKGNKIDDVKSLPIDKSEEWIIERKAVDIPADEFDLDEDVHVLICVAPETGVIGTEIIPADTPDSEALSMVLGFMLSPMEGKPRRPKSILLTGGELEALRPALIQTGSAVKIQSESDPFIDTIINLMAEGLSEKGISPYLMETDLNAEIVGEFFTAASQYYKLKPWKFFNFEIPMKIIIKGKKQKNYWAVVVGVSGEELGLSLFKFESDVRALYGDMDPEVVLSSGREINVLGFMYMHMKDIGKIAELEYQANEWMIASKSAYPSAIKFEMSGTKEPSLPDSKELIDLITVTRAVTEFCKTYRRQIKETDEEINCVDDTLTVPVAGQNVEVYIEFPAPEILVSDE